MTMNEFLTQLFAHMGMESVEITESEQENGLMVTIVVSEEDSGMIIGRRGETLDALQKIVRLVFQKDADKPITLNVNNFREHREEYLVELANRIASQVEQSGRPYTLDLPAHERRIVHMTLSESETVVTHSEGEGDRRVLIVEPKTHA